MPNEIRSYRIAEFIYKNYRPFGNINNYQIWISNDSQYRFMLDNEKENQKKIQYKNNNQFVTNNLTFTNNDQALILTTNGKDPHISSFLNLDDIIINEGRNYFLKLKYNSNISGNVQVFFSIDDKQFNEEDSIYVPIIKSTNLNDLYIPLPKLEGHKISNIRIDPPDGSKIEINDISLVAKNNSVIPIKSVSQQFDLKKLPFIWANYDDNQAALKSKDLFRLLIDQQELTPNQVLSLAITPIDDKETGNYLYLRLQSSKDAQVKIIYGEGSEISFDVQASSNYQDYIVRISSQWEWMEKQIQTINIISNQNIKIEKLTIKKGD
ncbi:hypothetical protein PAESOLCIP111_05426 [Paenibacillus solanacearum]|uniref:Uncharacterized protein n=1 Tax=Paenibacillus solanacearum TaxID=2048548 RepID=A0A916NKY4_9BACL|nr:hypothetical protein PAESOLCIP111_05426 [Paenibacillus solanacearum]